ncbi:hypothetical protein ACXZ9C_10995 [Streptococcus agalactiae]
MRSSRRRGVARRRVESSSWRHDGVSGAWRSVASRVALVSRRSGWSLSVGVESVVGRWSSSHRRGGDVVVFVVVGVVVVSFVGRSFVVGMLVLI